MSVLSEMLADMDRWVPARCKVCDRELYAIGDPTKPMLVPPEDSRSGPTGPQYRCADREECARHASAAEAP